MMNTFGYQELAKAVILAAMRDAKIRGYYWVNPQCPNRAFTGTEIQTLDQARAWLLDPAQTSFWCAWLDRDPRDLAKNVQEKIEGGQQ